MTQSGNFKFHTPIFRVNNRQENIDFYQNTLGFKLLTEENALLSSLTGQNITHFL